MGGYPSDQTPSRCNGYPIDWMILEVLWISLAIYPAGYHQLIPSGYVKIAIENGPLIVDLPTKNVIFNSYLSFQRVDGKHPMILDGLKMVETCFNHPLNWWFIGFRWPIHRFGMPWQWVFAPFGATHDLVTSSIIRYLFKSLKELLELLFLPNTH